MDAAHRIDLASSGLNVHDFSPCVGPANAGEMVFSNPQSRRAIGAPIRPGTCLSRGQAVSTGLDRPPVSALAADAGGDVVGRETCSLSALLALRSMAACQTSQSCPRTGSRSSVPVSYTHLTLPTIYSV